MCKQIWNKWENKIHNIIVSITGHQQSLKIKEYSSINKPKVGGYKNGEKHDITLPEVKWGKEYVTKWWKVFHK